MSTLIRAFTCFFFTVQSICTVKKTLYRELDKKQKISRLHLALYLLLDTRCVYLPQVHAGTLQISCYNYFIFGFTTMDFKPLLLQLTISFYHLLTILEQIQSSRF